MSATLDGVNRRPGYSAREVADLAGITYRQLDYWARTDMIRPTLRDAHGSGSRRRYSDDDLALLRLVKAMLDAGINLDTIRPVVTTIRSRELTNQAILILHDGTFSIAHTGESMSRYWRNGPCWIFPLNFEPVTLGVCQHHDYGHGNTPHPAGRACKFWRPTDS